MNYQDKSYMCISLKELPETERPREKMAENGASCMSNLELLCILLGSGSKQNPVQDVAKEVMDYISAHNLSDLQVSELVKIKGVGSAKAVTILSALELGKRISGSSKSQFRSPFDIWNEIRHFDDKRQEHFICILLNGAFEIISYEIITTGLVNKTLVHPREVFAPAIEKRATAIIVAHNHPSGNLQPSSDDIESTHRIKKAGDLLGIELVDHIIFSREDYHSLAESGQLLV